MIKTFCDRCKQETAETMSVRVNEQTYVRGTGREPTAPLTYELCAHCIKRVKQFLGGGAPTESASP